MVRFAMLLLLTASFSAAQIDVGHRLHAGQVPHKDHSDCVTSPVQVFPCAENLTLDGIHFDVVSFDADRVVRYLYTTDPAFTTKSGHHVGDWVTVNEKDIVLFPGWHICGPRTQDGWRVVLGFDVDKAEPLKFADSSPVNLVRTVDAAPKEGKLKIIGFEKGSV